MEQKEKVQDAQNRKTYVRPQIVQVRKLTDVAEGLVPDTGGTT